MWPLEWWSTALGPESHETAATPQREGVERANRGDFRDGREGLQQRRIVPAANAGRLLQRLDLQGQNATRVVAEIHGDQSHEASDEETGAREQDERKRDFARHQHLAQP